MQNNHPGRSESQQLLALTGLRFFAAAAIVFHHIRLNALKGYDLGWFNSVSAQCGPFGMTLFFVLSGFVIHYTYADRLHGLKGKEIYTYLTARLARLYPLYIAVVVLDLIIFGFTSDHLKSLLSFSTLTQSWLYYFIGSYPAALSLGYSNMTWSISTEMFCYLVFPLVLPFISKKMSVLRISLFLGSMVMVIAALNLSLQPNYESILTWAESVWGAKAGRGTADVYNFYSWLIFNSPYIRIWEFLLGVGIGRLYSWRVQVAPHDKNTWVSGVLMSVALLFIIGQLTLVYVSPFSWLYKTFGFSIWSAILVYSLARHQTFVARFLAHSWITRLGDASYSLYLLHGFVFAEVANRLWPKNPDVVPTIFRVLGCCLALAIISRLSYRYFENPMRNISRKFFKNFGERHLS